MTRSRILSLFMASALAALTVGAVLPPAPAQAQTQTQAASPQEPLRLSPAEAQQLAFSLLKSKHPAYARDIARGLLKADPDSYAAMMILARAETDLGRSAQGARAGRRAWQLAEGEEQEFAAAYMVSKSLTQMKRYGQAQFWLRRAGQAAEDDRMELAARKQFRRVQAMNPWSTQLSFSLRPSTNVNGGPTTNTFTIGDFVFIDPTAVPLSGVEYGVHASVRRDFSLSGNGPRAHLGFSIDDTRFTLSDSAKQAVPTARASDFSMTKAKLSGGLVLATSPTTATRIEVDLARDWRGGMAFSDSYSVELGQDRRFDRTRIGYGISYENRNRLDRASRSSETVSLQGYWAAPIKAGMLSISASVSDVQSAAGEVAAKAGTLSLRFVSGTEIFGAVPSLQVARIARDFDRVVYGAAPRQDRSTVISGELFFKNLDYFGFAPTVGAVYSRNRSNVSIFDYEEYGMTFGIRSTF